MIGIECFLIWMEGDISWANWHACIERNMIIKSKLKSHAFILHYESNNSDNSNNNNSIKELNNTCFN